MSPTDVKPVNCLVETAADVVCPQQGVVNTFGLIGDMGDNLIKSLGVAIARYDVTLGDCVVAVPPPRG